MGKEYASTNYFIGGDTRAALQRAHGIHQEVLVEQELERKQQTDLQQIWQKGTAFLQYGEPVYPKGGGILETKPVEIKSDETTFRVRMTGELTRVYSDGQKSIPVSGTWRLERFIPQEGGKEDITIPVYEVSVHEETGHASIKDFTRRDEEHEGHTHTKDNIKILTHIFSQMKAGK